jgi:hypothetical protein
MQQFYRLLIRDGKLKDRNYAIKEGGSLEFHRGSSKEISPESLAILQNEALEFIESCNDPTITPATVTVKSHASSSRPPRPRSTSIRPPLQDPSSEPQTALRHLPTRSTSILPPSPGRLDDPRPPRTRSTPVRPPSPDQSEDSPPPPPPRYGGRKMPIPERSFDDLATERRHGSGKSRQPKRPDPSTTIFRASFTSDFCLRGAIDPVTREPIITPMIDLSGWVMDLESWRLYFNGEASVPHYILAKSEKDLVEVTEKNFEQYRLSVVNIIC